MEDAALLVLEFDDRWLRCGLVPALLAGGGRPQACARAPPALRLALTGGLLRPGGGGGGAERRLGEELALALGALLSRALLVDPRACRVVLCEPPRCPEALRPALARALLQHAGVASLARAAAPACAALGCGAWSALVVALGERSAQVTPVVQGAPLAGREWACGAAALRAARAALLLGAAGAAAGGGGARSPSEAAAAAPSRAARRDPLAFAPSPFAGHPLSHPRAAALAAPPATPYGAASMPWVPGQRDFELLAGVAGAQGLAAPPAARAGAGAAAAAVASADAAAAGGDALWQSLDAWCEEAGPAQEPSGAAAAGALPLTVTVHLPPALAAALACPPALALPSDLWRAACSGEALLCPWLLERLHSAAQAALAPLLVPQPLPPSPTAAAAPLAHLAAVAHSALGTLLAPAQAPTDTLAEAVAGCLLEAPIDARRALAQCLVVCGAGGSAPPPGFAAALLAAVCAAVTGGGGRLRPLLPLLPHFRLGMPHSSLQQRRQQQQQQSAAGGGDSPCAALLGGAVLAKALALSGELAAVSITGAAVEACGAATAAAPASVVASVAVAAAAAKAAPAAAPSSAAARLALLSKGLQGGRGQAHKQ
jgi:hypothetical protein